ncbi:MAG: DUF721 domain-containing protein [Alphaproteobacteria bacterium TMED93]|nr:MAG: DUF721 domain-containing protein [Alphaproteobacteria bacterium TMED93]
MHTFKKIDIITRNITNKIFKKYNYNFIIINEKWEDIVGKQLYKVSSPLNISRDKVLTVGVKNNYIVDFQYSMPTINNNLQKILKNQINLKIKIRQLQ